MHFLSLGASGVRWNVKDGKQFINTLYIIRNVMQLRVYSWNYANFSLALRLLLATVYWNDKNLWIPINGKGKHEVNVQSEDLIYSVDKGLQLVVFYISTRYESIVSIIVMMHNISSFLYLTEHAAYYPSKIARYFYCLLCYGDLSLLARKWVK